MQYSIVFVGADKGGARSPLRRGDYSFFGALIRQWPDRRLLVIIQHMLQLCQASMVGRFPVSAAIALEAFSGQWEREEFGFRWRFGRGEGEGQGVGLVGAWES